MVDDLTVKNVIKSDKNKEGTKEEKLSRASFKIVNSFLKEIRLSDSDILDITLEKVNFQRRLYNDVFKDQIMVEVGEFDSIRKIKTNLKFLNRKHLGRDS